MSRRCTVCGHPNRAEIEAELVANRATRAIARQWSVGREALTRHLANHLPKKLAKAAEAEQAAEADALLAQLQELQAMAVGVARIALGTSYAGAEGITLTFGDDSGPAERAHVAMRAIREARATLDLLARLEEELPTEDGTLVIVYENDWIPDG